MLSELSFNTEWVICFPPTWAMRMIAKGLCYSHQRCPLSLADHSYSVTYVPGDLSYHRKIYLRCLDQLCAGSQAPWFSHVKLLMCNGQGQMAPDLVSRWSELYSDNSTLQSWLSLCAALPLNLHCYLQSSTIIFSSRKKVWAVWDRLQCCPQPACRFTRPEERLQRYLGAGRPPVWKKRVCSRLSQTEDSSS